VPEPQKKKRLRKIVAGTLLSLSAITIGTAPSASAWLAPYPTTRYPDSGGTWKYGYTLLKARSYYLNISRCHGSSLYVNSSYTRSTDTAAGVYSDAHINTIDGWWQDERYYYRIC
jgi:Bacteriocin (Lactococcin_972)